MPSLTPLVSDALTATEAISFRFNPGVPVVADAITVSESVTLRRSLLEINVAETIPVGEVAIPFTIALQDTQGSGGSGGSGSGLSGAANELWQPVWLIDMSQITVLPAGILAASLRFSNRDIDALSPPYHGRVVDNPSIDRRLMNVFWGITEIADVTFTLVNTDGALTPLYTQADLREQPITITRYDVASGIIAEEYHARISSVGLQTGKLMITASSPALTLFEQLVPSEVIDKSTYPKAVSVGQPLPVVFGIPKKIPLPYINDDTVTNTYDYVVGYGALTVDALYRNGPNDTLVTVTTPEYSIHTDLAAYPGLTIARFTFRQVDFTGGFHQIFADVTGPSRNFADAIKQVLTDTTWGLGQAVDAASFATAAADLDAFGGMFCDGVVNQQVQAQDLLRLLMIVRGMRLGFSSNNEWTLVVDKVPVSIKMRIRDGVGDGERNIQQAGNRVLVPTSSAVSQYTVKYRLNFPNGGSSTDYDFSQTRPVNNFGKETILEQPFIRDHETADRVTDYLAKREKYSQDSCDFEVTQEARQLREGDLVSVTYIPNGYSDTIAEVREIEKKIDTNRVVVSAWDASIFVYQPGTLPTDFTDTVGVLFIPRPGYLEIPGQRLNQVFTGPDIFIHWAAVSEIFIGAQDEENLPGALIVGYWVTTVVNGVTVREEFTPLTAYIYTLVMNKADNPPNGARTITFLVQAQASDGSLGEQNYITVTNGAQDLAPLAVGPVVDDTGAVDVVQVLYGFTPGNVYDLDPPTEFVDVIVGGSRRINVADYPNNSFVQESVTVRINVVLVSTVDYVDEYDKVVDIRNSKFLGILVVEDTPASDGVTVVKSA